MNYFAHALPFLDEPTFMAATGVPDWLAVVDRQVRLRLKHAEAFRQDERPWVAQVAGGVCQHLRDDAQFHHTRAFVETSLAMSVQARNVLSAVEEEAGMRPAFLGHLLTEVLLDAALITEHPAQLEEYYRLLDTVDPAQIQAAVNLMAPQPSEGLALMIVHFRRERILWDYLKDDTLMVRLNQVMRRVKLAPLPAEFAAVLPEARRLVAGRSRELLEGIPA